MDFNSTDDYILVMFRIPKGLWSMIYMYVHESDPILPFVILFCFFFFSIFAGCGESEVDCSCKTLSDSCNIIHWGLSHSLLRAQVLLKNSNLIEKFTKKITKVLQTCRGRKTKHTFDDDSVCPSYCFRCYSRKHRWFSNMFVLTQN